MTGFRQLRSVGSFVERRTCGWRRVEWCLLTTLSLGDMMTGLIRNRGVGELRTGRLSLRVMRRVSVCLVEHLVGLFICGLLIDRFYLVYLGALNLFSGNSSTEIQCPAYTRRRWRSISTLVDE
jgi:hypothetical protein